jgi:hypothetical protein
MTASGAMVESQQDTESQSPWRRMFLRGGRIDLHVTGDGNSATSGR